MLPVHRATLVGDILNTVSLIGRVQDFGNQFQIPNS